MTLDAHPRRGSRRARAVLAIPVTLVLAAGLLGAPAYAETAESPAPTSTPSPTAAPEQTPAAPSPTAAADTGATAVRAAQTVQRSAVPKTATGFQLRYAFYAGVQPARPEHTSDVAAEKTYDWSDGGIHYLQWDYPMPDDGHHKVTFTAQLIDHGQLTDYNVRYTSTVNRTAGSVSVETDCAVLRGDDPADLNGESPFTCDGAAVQAASGAVLATSSVALLNWSTITGIIDVRNSGTGPLISLAEGTFSTANQQQRIIMNDEAWYPVDASLEEQRALPYATIANGGQLTWSAAQQNSGITQSEPDTHAQATFSYRILLDGKATSFWISGWAENYKYLSGSEPSAECSIFLGDPNDTGRRVLENVPFTCEPTGMTKPNVKTDDDTTFKVRMARVDTLKKQTDATKHGLEAACAPEGNGCVQAIGEPSFHHDTAAGAHTIATEPHTAGAPEPEKWEFERSWSREVTDSVEQSFGVTVSYETEVEPIPGEKETFGVEFSSETSYGYDLTKGLEYKFSARPLIPFGAIGRMVQYDAWDLYEGDLYFFGEGDSWYRVTGTTIKIPVDAAMYSAESQTFDGHIDAQQGVEIGGVEFRCSWEESAEANVLLHNPTLEALTVCEIPAKWSDKVPHIPGVDLDPDLIKDARAVMANNLDELNGQIKERAEKLNDARQG